VKRIDPSPPSVFVAQDIARLEITPASVARRCVPGQAARGTDGPGERPAWIAAPTSRALPASGRCELVRMPRSDHAARVA
jgi:hypothetical protein